MKAPILFIPAKTIVHPGIAIIEVPLRISSAANERVHWRARAKRAQHHRNLAALVTQAAMIGSKLADYPAWRVTLTRIAPKVLDMDNNIYAFKALRDGVADALKVDDGDISRVRWEYGQDKRGARLYGLRVEVVGMRGLWNREAT